MFMFWLVFGIVTVLMGVFNKQLLRILGLKPMSEVFTTPHLRQSSKRIEQMGQWFVVLLGMSFFVQGLGAALPHDLSLKISSVLAGLCFLLLLAMLGIGLANWKAK